ncbi:MAG TPA: hypothetical protein ENI51_03700 [Candidatus Atribacteria bacterium]|nr:hypothetical protein [Candidatus Atribacteria bacterium]
MEGYKERKHMDRYQLFIILLSLAGFFLILLSTSRYGAGIAADSVTYISGAKSLLEGKGYRHYLGHPLTLYPPLFPLVLSLFEFLGLNLSESIRYLHAVFFGLIIFISGRWLLKKLIYWPLVFFGSLVILFSMPLIRVHIHILSEPLFILIVFLFTLEIQQYLENRKKKFLIFSAILSAMASLTRYIGITTVFTGILLLLFNRTFTLKKRFKDSLNFTLISLFPLIYWSFKMNLLFTPKIEGLTSSSTSLLENLYNTLDTISLWILPSNIGTPLLRIGVILGIFISISGTFMLGVRKNQDSKVFLRQISSFGTFSFVYIIFLIVLASIFALERICGRFLAPIYLPIVLVLVFMIDKIFYLFSRFLSSQRLKVFLPIVFIFCFWLLYPILRVGKNIKYYLYVGTGEYSSKIWKDSEVIRYLRKHPCEEEIYSNAPDAIYFFTNIPAKMSPRKYLYNMHTPTDDILKLKKALNLNNNIFLVWFDNKFRNYLYNVEELKSIFDLKPLVSLGDGTIYRLRLKN